MTTEYETVCVIQPDVQGEKLTKITDKIQKIMNDHKGKQLESRNWGIRRLAYPIKKYKNANYLYISYEGNGTLVNDLERNLGYEETVLRFLTIKLDKKTKRLDAIENANFTFSEGHGERHDRGGGGDRYDRHERNERFDRN